MDAVILRQAQSETLQIRTYHERLFADRVAEMRGIEEYRQIDDKYLDICFAISKGEAYGEDTSALEIERERVSRERDAILVKLGYPLDYLTRTHTCPICLDEGYIGGEICACVKKRVASIAKRNCKVPNLDKYTFENFDESIFEGSKQYKAMTALYRAMQTYVDKYPLVKYRNIVLMSPTGVGKTSLVSCMVNALIDKGVDVNYITAFEMNDLMVKYHTTMSDARDIYMQKLLSCDVLVIDDLGVEPILNNVTVENLLTVLNERKNRGLHTIISTNLDVEGIRLKYGERVWSRLFDKEDTLARSIDGDDLRIINNGKTR